MGEDKHRLDVVEDDASMRRALRLLLGSHGYEVEAFADARSFLATVLKRRPDCVILDVRLPGMSGIDVLARLHDLDFDVPVVMITGHGDVPMAVRAMRMGAADFLEKPFEDFDLIASIGRAISTQRARHAAPAVSESFRAKLDALTPRQREVAELIAEGLTNKSIASTLGVSPRTVEVHRANALRRLGVRSAAELVREMLGDGAAGAGLRRST